MIGIIAGTGVEKLFEHPQRKKVDTKYGAPSDEITLGEINGVETALLPRHGREHTIPPHSINYRANIQALKDIGVTRIISPCAVGSLKEEYNPGDVVVADQFVDFTKKREYTFYDHGRVCHIGVAEPFCKDMRQTAIKACQKLDIPHKEKGTYVCIEGPRFSTKAESKMFSSFADIIGMTLVPEAQLAREQEICYLSLATVTDYDVWKEHPVTFQEVSRVMKENEEKIKLLVTEIISSLPKERGCECSTAMAIYKKMWSEQE